MASDVRDLTDPAQNQAVLDAASALLDGTADMEAVTREHGAAVAAEADAARRSRAALPAGPLHLSVVWAMYGETGRMATREEHPHGEDLVRVKVRQLDWLTRGTDVTWSVIGVDDGCPDEPSSADVMEQIVAREGLPSDAHAHRGAAVLRLADVLGGGPSIGPAFDALTSTEQSRKGGAILAGLAHATRADHPVAHVVAYTDADLSANLAQLATLASPIAGAAGTARAALGQRYGMRGATLVKAHGPVTEPESTGGKPDKVIVLLRHAVRAALVPDLAHVLDTQAGFKAFDAGALRPVLPRMASFDETFDVELLVLLAQQHGGHALATAPMVFTEDFAATNFPSVDPGAGHLAMLRQIAQLHDRLVAPAAPATGEALQIRRLVDDLDLPAYVRLVEGLRREDAGDPTLFERRWPAAHLRALAEI